MKNLICEGCGKAVEFLMMLSGLKLCEECENNHRQVMDDLADSKASEIYGDL